MVIKIELLIVLKQRISVICREWATIRVHVPKPRNPEPCQDTEQNKAWLQWTYFKRVNIVVWLKKANRFFSLDMFVSLLQRRWKKKKRYPKYSYSLGSRTCKSLNDSYRSDATVTVATTRAIIPKTFTDSDTEFAVVTLQKIESHFSPLSRLEQGRSACLQEISCRQKVSWKWLVYQEHW